MKRPLIGMLSLLALACGNPTALDDAWAKFEAKDYDGAHLAFSDLAAQGAAAPIYVGLGWTAMRMDSLAAADAYFAAALTLPDSENTLQDGYAGWSVVAWAMQNHAACITYSQNVLTQDDFYVFVHDRSVTYQDLLLHEAYSYYYLTDYLHCIDRIQAIDPAFIAPDISDPGTPVILLAKMESLLGVVG